MVLPLAVHARISPAPGNKAQARQVDRLPYILLRTWRRLALAAPRPICSVEHVWQSDRNFWNQEHQAKPQQLEQYERPDRAIDIHEADIRRQRTFQPEQYEAKWRGEISDLDVDDEKRAEPELVDTQLIYNRNEKRRAQKDDRPVIHDHSQEENDHHH